MRTSFSITVVALLAATALTAAGAHHVGAETPLSFSSVQDLGGPGGEPSIQDDGNGNVYITSPVGGPAGVNRQVGVQFWHSSNGGASFGPSKNIGFQLGGFDSDVTTDNTGFLYVADLEAAATYITTSGDHGANFTSPVKSTQAGPEDDREWLTTVGSNTVYLTYHDLAAGVPLIFKSTDRGKTFTRAGNIFGTNSAFIADAAANTLLSKPVVDAAGNIFILTNTSTAAQNLNNNGTGPFDRLYLSESTDGGMTFTATLISDTSNGSTTNAKSGTYAKVFNQLAIDAGGNLYIAAAGTLMTPAAGAPNSNMFLIRGIKQGDGTYQWKNPVQLTSDHAQVFPAIAVGQAGQVAVGYYGTTTVAGCAASCYNDYRNDSNKFQYYVTETLNALDPNPTFSAPTQVTTTPPHPGGICTDGVFCGTPLSSGGNRNLADFESMTVDPAGNIELVIPADQDGTNTHNLFYKQATGPQLVPGATNGNGTGNRTYVNNTGGQVPEAPWASALLLVGAAGAAAVMVRGRRREDSPGTAR
ncbi:MAG: exo-alpha-sialidase [Candidatus Dormibacteraeota bacterium]|uniref:Exo-alpha-sialidase n=1 Tax=Candidatus Amunia macphersoniae TaxID=3127014 RepID=A0A934KL08_9BACT|nr:exo-alpha-sialidase [Candidatus Dormibacteraeota bacterium]